MRHWVERIRYHGLVEPEATAIVTADRAVTYGMLRQGIDTVQVRVQAAGMAPSAACAVMMDNPIRQVVVCLALQQAGIPYLSLEPGQGGLQGLAGSSIGTLLFGSGVFGSGGQVPPALSALRHIEVTDDWFQAASASPAPVPPPTADKIVRYGLTSGSTGEPKLVTYTAGYVSEQIATKLLTELVPVRRGMLVMPGMSSNVGFLSACAALVVGRMACLVDSAEQALRLIDLYGIDAGRASVEQLIVLTRAAKASTYRMSSLERIDCIGGRASRVLLEQAALNLCRQVRISYGSSETGRIAMAPASEVVERPGLVGYPLPGVEVAVVDAHGMALPAGTIGSIAVRKAVLAGGTGAGGTSAGPDGSKSWVKPGDIGWFDDDGRLYVVGRSSDGTAAEKGWSEVLEAEHLFRLGADANDAAAMEVDDPARPGERLIWIGVAGKPGPGAEPAAFARRLAARGIASGVRVVQVDAIPRGANGKVRRTLFHEMLQQAIQSSQVAQSGRVS